MKKEIVLERFLTQMPARFEVASGQDVFSAVSIDIETGTGKCVHISRIYNISN